MALHLLTTMPNVLSTPRMLEWVAFLLFRCTVYTEWMESLQASRDDLEWPTPNGMRGGHQQVNQEIWTHLVEDVSLTFAAP